MPVTEKIALLRQLEDYIRRDELPTMAALIGPAGPPGAAGPSGPMGPAGPEGPEGVPGGIVSDTGRLYDKGGMQHNARGYGAVGNGVADDTQAFLDLIADLPSRGGVMVVPPGIYRVSEEFVFTKPVTIWGASNTPNAPGVGTWIVFAPGTSGVHFQPSSSGSHMSNLTLVGTRGGNTVDGVLIQGHGIVMHNVTIDSFEGRGLVFDSSVTGNANRCYLVNVRVSGTGGRGWHILGGDSNALTVINGDASTVGEVGIWNQGSHNIFINFHVNTTGVEVPGSAGFVEGGNGNYWLRPYAEGGAYFDINGGTHGDVIFSSSFGRPEERWITPASRSSMNVEDPSGGKFRMRMRDRKVAVSGGAFAASDLWEWYFPEPGKLAWENNTKGLTAMTLDLVDASPVNWLVDWGLHHRLANGKNLILGVGTGTMIGTSPGQKLGFWGKAGVTRPGPIALLPEDGSATNGQIAATINALILSLRSPGLIQDGNP